MNVLVKCFTVSLCSQNGPPKCSILTEFEWEGFTAKTVSCFSNLPSVSSGENTSNTSSHFTECTLHVLKKDSVGQAVY